LTRAFCGALSKNSLSGSTLRHRCDTLPGSSGALIFSLERNAVIGRALVGIHHRGGLTMTDTSSFNPGTHLPSLMKVSKVLAAIANEVPKDVSNACALYPSLCASPAATNGRGCCIGEKWASVLPAKYELLGSELKTTSGHPELDEVLAKVVATMSG